MADLLGVVVVPLSLAETVVEAAGEQAEREARTRDWVRQGRTVEDLLREFGRI